MILEPTRQTNAAEHGGVERQLPGDHRGRDAVVRRQEVEQEAGGCHRVDGVCGDGVSQGVQDRRQSIACDYEQCGCLDCLVKVVNNLGFIPGHYEEIPDETDNQGDQGDIGGFDIDRLDEAVAGPDNDDKTDADGHLCPTHQTLGQAVGHQVLVISPGCQETFLRSVVIRKSSSLIQHFPPFPKFSIGHFSLCKSI